MVKCIIVEDDPIYSKQLCDLLSNFNNQIEICSICRNVTEALNAVFEFDPELIFLDIELEGEETGFDLLKRIDKINFNVIFTTSHINDYINEIRICGIGFIAKPYILGELSDIVNKFLSRNKPNVGIEQLNALKDNLQTKNTDDKIIWIAKGSSYMKVDINNIIYCESDDPVTYFFLANPIDGVNKLTSTVSIKEYEVSFNNSSIIRIHNSYLVNIKYIKKYIRGDGGSVLLNNNETLNVSKSRKEYLLKRLGIKR